MSTPPDHPKIFHITHVENLASIVEAGAISSDAKRSIQGTAHTNVGMREIKQRRLALDVDCHPGTTVGQYVPFYFCPRSVMLYVLDRANHPGLSYRGGQRSIVHLEADLHATIQWAQAHNRRWAFTASNAGARYTSFFNTVERLTEIDWEAVAARQWSASATKEGKQAEFLLYDACPVDLIERIGVMDAQMEHQVTEIIDRAQLDTPVSVQRTWYY